jgi:putative inorganic carbon (HCO3(-)) transporter
MIANQSLDRSPRMRWLLAVLAVLVGGVVAMTVSMFPSTTKLLVLVAGAAAAAATIYRVEWGLLALIWMGYTRFSDVMVNNGAPSTATAFLGLLFLIIILRWILYNEKPQDWMVATTMIVLYGMVGMATFLYADDTVRVQSGVISYFKDAVIVVVIVILLRQPTTLRSAMWALLAAGIFMASLTTWQQLTGTFDNDYWGFAKAGRMQIVAGVEDDFRIAGPIGDPNFYSQVLLVLVPLAMDRMRHEKKKWLRMVAGYTLFVCIFSIFMTFSRGAFLSMIIIIVMMLIKNPPKPLTFLIAIAIVVPLFSVLPPSYTARLQTIPDAIPGLTDKDVREEASFRGRSSAQQAGWLMFLDNPLFGLGVGNFGNHYQEYSRGLGIDSSRWDQAPHNLYLEIVTEKGLFGLSVFALLIGTMFAGIGRARRQFIDQGEPSLASLVVAFRIGIIGYMIAGTFLQLSYPRFFWVLIGIGFAIPNVAQNMIDKQREAHHG